MVATTINGELPSNNKPRGGGGGGIGGNVGWPNKSKIPLRTIMIQIRNGSPRLPPGLMLKQPSQSHHNRIIRPTILKINPNFMFKSQHPFPRPIMNKQRPLYSAPPSQQQPMKQFQSSPAGPNTGEYVYENPFKTSLTLPLATTTNNHHQHQIDNSIHNNGPSLSSQSSLHHQHHHQSENSGPIHTIPAPNLANNNNFIPEFATGTFHDNHLSLTDQHQHQSTFRPSSTLVHHHHQYQVTEDPTNDQTIHDPFSGQHKYFAPDPDPSLPSKRIQQANDHFSQPSNGNPLPLDVATSASLSQQLYHFVDSVPQQQLPDTYGLPITNQPQLQQHLLQQSSMPLSVSVLLSKK